MSSQSSGMPMGVTITFASRRGRRPIRRLLPGEATSRSADRTSVTAAVEIEPLLVTYVVRAAPGDHSTRGSWRESVSGRSHGRSVGEPGSVGVGDVGRPAAPRPAGRSAGGGALRSVPVDVVRGSLGGVPGAEVGAVAVEDVDPLAAGVVDGLGDEVGDVAVAAAGHADVGRGGAGRLAECEVCGVDGLALGSVGGGGEGELDVLADVSAGSVRWPARPVTSRLPSSPIPATVQVSRLATARSRSLRRVATRSPRPIRSPRRVMGSPARSPVAHRLCSSAPWRRSRMAALSAPTWSRVSAMTSWSPCQRRRRRSRPGLLCVRPRWHGGRSGRARGAASKTSPDRSPVRMSRLRSA